jgi:hypothetical protein
MLLKAEKVVMFRLCVDFFKKNKTSQRRDAEALRKEKEKEKESKIVSDKRFSLLFVFPPRLGVSALRGLVFILFIINTLSKHSRKSEYPSNF